MVKVKKKLSVHTIGIVENSSSMLKYQFWKTPCIYPLHPLLSALLNIEHNSSCVGTESKLPVDTVDVVLPVKCDTGSALLCMIPENKAAQTASCGTRWWIYYEQAAILESFGRMIFLQGHITAKVYSYMALAQSPKMKTCVLLWHCQISRGYRYSNEFSIFFLCGHINHAEKSKRSYRTRGYKFGSCFFWTPLSLLLASLYKDKSSATVWCRSSWSDVMHSML